MKPLSPTALLPLLVVSGAVLPAVRAADPPASVPGWITSLAAPNNPGNQSEEYTIGVDTAAVHSGKKSVHIKSIVDKPKNFRSCTQGIKADAFRGKRVRLTGWVKTKDVTATNSEDEAGLWMRVDGPNGSALAFDNMAKRPVKGTTDWKAYAIVLDVPKSAEAVYFGALLSGSGTLWMDDLRLETVDAKSVATTGSDQKAEEADTEKYIAALPSQGVNLGFEAPAPADASKPPSSWFILGNGDAGSGYGLDNTEKRSGASSAFMKAEGDNPEAFNGLRQPIKADAYRGKRVRFSGYLKTDHVAGWTGLWMNAYGKQNQGFVLDTMHDDKADRSLHGTADWQPCFIVLDVPKNAMMMNFGAMLSGSGKVWVDDLKLETVDPKTVAVTGKPVSENAMVTKAKDAMKKQLAAMPSVPQNLDFEK